MIIMDKERQGSPKTLIGYDAQAPKDSQTAAAYLVFIRMELSYTALADEAASRILQVVP